MRLVVWDSFTFLIRGEKLSGIVAAEAQKKGVENVVVNFGDGFMSIQGLVRKFIGIPFSIILSDPVTTGVTVSLRIESAAAFGFIPLPKLLLYIAEGFMELPDYWLEQWGSNNKFNIQGLTPATGATEAQVEAYVSSKDTGGANVEAFGATSVVYTGNGVCSTP